MPHKSRDARLAYAKLYREKYPARQRAWQKDWYKRNKTQADLKCAASRLAHPGRQSGYARKYKYGITQAQYDELYLAQSGCCAICKRVKKLVVDHCHRSKQVRGLLCSTCNTGIGHLNDDPALLSLALEYLRD